MPSSCQGIGFSDCRFGDRGFVPGVWGVEASCCSIPTRSSFFWGWGGFEPTKPDKAHLETIIEARFAPPGFCNEGPASHHHSHHSPTISGALLFFPVPLCIFVSFFGG